MPAPKGHPLWGNPLKPKKYATPEELWDAAVEYFDYCDENPWYKSEAIKGGDLAGSLVEVPTQRPYTFQGLCNFLNITYQTFSNYEKAKGYETYFEICTHIRAIIEQNQLEGATVGAYNHAIIARLLGLAENVNTNTTSKQEIIVSSDSDKGTVEGLFAKLDDE